MAGIPTDRFEEVQVSSTAELHDWLAANHGQAENIWLVTFKKSVPEKYVSDRDKRRRGQKAIKTVPKG